MFEKKFRKLNKKYHLTIGADPEFALYDLRKRTYVGAYKFFDTMGGEIGTDGERYQLELRPAPAATPAEFVENFRSTLTRAATFFPPHIDIRLGGPWSLGGHLHLGTPDLVRLDDHRHTLLEEWDEIFSPTSRLTSRWGYGLPSDHRLPEYGIEYRTPSAAIFLSPSILSLSLTFFLATAYIILYRVSFPPLPPRWGKIWSKFLQGCYRRCSLLRRWKLRCSGKPIVFIEFRDEWNIEIERYFHDILISSLSTSIPTEYSPLHIILYGLREDRGLVSTIPCPISGIPTIPHPQSYERHSTPHWEDGHFTITVGVPYVLRTHRHPLSEAYIQDLKDFIIKMT